MTQQPSRPTATKTKLAVAMSILLASALGLAACDKQPDNTTKDAIEHPSDSNANTSNASDSNIGDSDVSNNNMSETSNLNDAANTQEPSTAEMVSTRDKALSIDWGKVDSGVKPIDKKDVNYPFKLDSDSVESQAKFSNISNEQAQHSLTVGMASNEPLEALLDQLGDSYLSHTYSVSDATLYVDTTPNVVPSHFDYVIAHEFAKGLILPIEVRPQSKADTDTVSNRAQ